MSVGVSSDTPSASFKEYMSNARNLSKLKPSNVGQITATYIDVTTLPVGSSPGTIVPFGGATVPTGWLLCFGQAISRATYATLFTVVSTTHGVGDGSTTFNLPDLRGRIPGGKDDMGGTAASRLTTAGSGVNGASLGASGGAQTHSLTQAQLPALTFLTTTNSGQGAPSLDFSGPDNLGFYSIGGGTAHNNTQPTIVLNYIIKT